MFERYTESARRVIFFARYEATHHSVGKITTGHILLGLVREGGSRTDAVLPLKEHEERIRLSLGIPRSTARMNIAEIMREMPLSDDSKRVLAYAAQEAAADRAFNIETDHLLRGILCFPNEAASTLQFLSLDLATAQVISRRNRVEFPEKRTLYLWLFGAPFRAHRVLLIKLLAVVIVFLLSALVIRWLN